MYTIGSKSDEESAYALNPQMVADAVIGAVIDGICISLSIVDLTTIERRLMAEIIQMNDELACLGLL